MSGPLRVALVGGPMYDGLYEVFVPGEVEVVVHADHPTLNREVARRLAAGERLDVISTHSKYAPSQAAWLLGLDGLVDTDALAPRAVELSRFGGRLLCAPRNIDVRTLWVRADLVDPVPRTWAELDHSRAVFGFTGRESGLFGTFFEIVTALGGRLFDDDHRPVMASAEAEEAVALLVRLAGRAPAELPEWHYDDVDDALVHGAVDLAAMWPGGTDVVRRSPLRHLLAPHPYFAGAMGVRSYSGCHGWAVPSTAADPAASAALVQRLVGFEAQALDAQAGTVCAHVEAFAAVEPADATDARRLEVLRGTIALGMITYPPLARFPAIEDAGWAAIREALLGNLTPAVAVAAVQARAERVLAAS